MSWDSHNKHLLTPWTSCCCLRSAEVMKSASSLHDVATLSTHVNNHLLNRKCIQNTIYWVNSAMHLTHTHPFNGPFSGTTQVSRYQKGKTYLDFTEARDSEWQWHQLGHMQVCTSLQTDDHASTPPLSLLQAGCPSCRPTNSIKALKAKHLTGVTKSSTSFARVKTGMSPLPGGR